VSQHSDGTARPATHWPRLAATLADVLLVTACVYPALLLTDTSPDWVVLGVVLVAAGVPTFLVEAMTGRSLGKAAMGLLHTAPGDEAPDDRSFLPRYGVKWLIPLVFISLGLAGAALAWWVIDYAPALRGDRRTIHDRIAGTRVLTAAINVRNV
jgi:uncharacterized RDD family membrane protein YckC